MAAPGACIDIHLGLVLYCVFGDNIDNTANCITAIQGTAAALDNFNALDIVYRRYHIQVSTKLAACRALVIVQLLPVNHNNNPVIAIDAHIAAQTASHAHNRHAIYMADCLIHALIMIILNLLCRNDRSIGRCLHFLSRPAFRCNYSILQLIHICCHIGRFAMYCLCCKSRSSHSGTCQKRSHYLHSQFLFPISHLLHTISLLF